MTVLWSWFSLDLLPKLLHWHVLFRIFLHHLRWTENINVMSSLKINKNFFIELIINYMSKIMMKTPNPNHAGHLLYNHNVLFFSSKYFCLPYCRDVHVVTQLFIIHQIFLLARDWSKHATWANIPQFLKPMDNKHNSLNLAAKICLDICPWTFSVPRSSQFSSSFGLGKLCASRNR